MPRSGLLSWWDISKWLVIQNHPVLQLSQNPLYSLHFTSIISHGRLIWFQYLENSWTIQNWEGFVQAFLIRFGPSSYNDPMEMLIRLRQFGSVETYKSQFEALSNRLRSLIKSYKLSCFLSELKDKIRLPIRMLILLIWSQPMVSLQFKRSIWCLIEEPLRGCCPHHIHTTHSYITQTVHPTIHITNHKLEKLTHFKNLHPNTWKKAERKDYAIIVMRSGPLNMFAKIQSCS